MEVAAAVTSPRADAPAAAETAETGTVGRIVRRSLSGLGRDRTTTSLALFTFLVVKILLVTHGDLVTSLALLNDAGLVPVVVGVIVSATPIVAASVMAAAVYGWASGSWRWERPGSQRCVVVLVVLVSAWFTPWYLFVPAALSALGIGALDREPAGDGAPVASAPSLHHRAGRGATRLGGALVVYALGASLFTMWLPHERLTVRDAPKPVIGYVVGEKGAWVNVLTSGHRRIMRIPSGDVVARTLCRGSDYHESPIQWAARRLGHQLEYPPRCRLP